MYLQKVTAQKNKTIIISPDRAKHNRSSLSCPAHRKGSRRNVGPGSLRNNFSLIKKRKITKLANKNQHFC
ncbi:MAG: hypothetical protein D3908_12085 [Candidatus Electrothrix sp. AUS4]|nr:hypothetical protein [Candidatus Electrothrix sp. AUS4]